jgi:predicted DNA-binding transcriptional regulator AlpA
MENRASPAPTSSIVLLTPEAICKVLSISRRTLRYWINKNQFPQPLRVGPDGRLLRWHPADLVDYLKRTRGHVGAAAALKDFPNSAAKSPAPEMAK